MTNLVVPNPRSWPMLWKGIIGLSALGKNTIFTPEVFLTSSNPPSRRICPGVVVAERELWLAIARLLWAFTIKPVPGEPISLEEYEGQSGRTPLPFRVELVPRHADVPALLETQEETKI